MELIKALAGPVLAMALIIAVAGLVAYHFAESMVVIDLRDDCGKI